jgi:hypothetical protein
MHTMNIDLARQLFEDRRRRFTPEPVHASRSTARSPLVERLRVTIAPRRAE